MKYKVNDTVELVRIISESGFTVNSLSNKMHASSTYLKSVIYGKQAVFPPYAKRVVEALNSEGNDLTIPDIFFEYNVGKSQQKEKVS